jgi:hypothetical protein
MRNLDDMAKIMGLVPGLRWAAIIANLMKPAVGAAENIQKEEE